MLNVDNKYVELSKVCIGLLLSDEIEETEVNSGFSMTWGKKTSVPPKELHCKYSMHYYLYSFRNDREGVVQIQ